MKYLLTLFPAFLLTTALAQNYNLIVTNPGEAVYFEDRKGRITTLAVESKTTNNTQVTWELEPRGDLFFPSWNPDEDSVHASFLGTSLTVDANGKTVVQNSATKEGFTICQSCKKGESWTVRETPQLTAIISDIVVETVNGSSDSVKIILFSDKTEMRISKKNGVLATPIFFPRYQNFILKQRAPVILTTRDVYDMDTGDVFHWSVSRGYLKKEKHILTVLTKAVDTLGKLVTYSVDRLRESYLDGVTHEIITWVYPYSNTPLFDVLPGELKDHPNSQAPEHWKTSYFLTHNAENKFGDTAWNRLYADYKYLTGLQTPQEYYIKGCGDYYYSAPESESDNYYRTLVYYKKGTDEWGKGLTINVPCICPAKLSTPLIYPNLANQIIFISDEREYGMATLQSLNGRVELIDLSNGKYNINHLAEGAYFIRFKSGRREKFMVAR